MSKLYSNETYKWLCCRCKTVEYGRVMVCLHPTATVEAMKAHILEKHGNIFKVKYSEVNAGLSSDAVEESLANGEKIEDFVPEMYEVGFDMGVFEN